MFALETVGSCFKDSQTSIHFRNAVDRVCERLSSLHESVQVENSGEVGALAASGLRRCCHFLLRSLVQSIMFHDVVTVQSLLCELILTVRGQEVATTTTPGPERLQVHDASVK